MLSTPKAIIWDLDNTLYKFNNALKHHCNIAAARAVIDCGLDLEFDAALQIATQSERTYNYSLHEFILNHGFEYKDLHHPFHDYIDESLILPIDGLAQNLRQFNAPQSILTNASQSWTMRVLKILGMNDIFDLDLIFCMENFNFSPKARNNDGLHLAINKLGHNPKDIIFIDDLPRNLKKAKETNVQTGLTHNDTALNKQSYIDYYFNCTNDLFDRF